MPDKYFEGNEIGISGLLEDRVTRTNDAKKETDSFFFRDGAPTRKVSGKNIDSPSSGSTIRSKIQFCETAVNIMKSEDYEWKLTSDLNGLCDRLWAFIEECN